jgi:hypothetical protein
MPPFTVEIVRIPSLSNRSCLENISCLQMTDTGLYLNWDPTTLTDHYDDEEEQLFYRSLQYEPLYSSTFPLPSLSHS